MSGEIAGGLLPTGEYGHTLNNPMYDSGRKKRVSVHKTFQEDMAIEVEKDLKVPEGWGVVVIGYGDDPSQMGPVTVTWNDWVLDSQGIPVELSLRDILQYLWMQLKLSIIRHRKVHL